MEEIKKLPLNKREPFAAALETASPPAVLPTARSLFLKDGSIGDCRDRVGTRASGVLCIEGAWEPDR